MYVNNGSFSHRLFIAATGLMLLLLRQPCCFTNHGCKSFMNRLAAVTRQWSQLDSICVSLITACLWLCTCACSLSACWLLISRLISGLCCVINQHCPMYTSTTDLRQSGTDCCTRCVNVKYTNVCNIISHSPASSVRITKMLMGGGFASEASEKIFFSGPSWGGPEKLQADCLVVTNSANCFMLFIVNSTKSFVEPVVTTVIYFVYN